MLSLIVAHDKNRLIGLNGKLPWDLKGDLAHFKDLTVNNIVIMGRKTYESIGKALPYRKNIVVSKTLEANEYIHVASSLQDALRLARLIDKDKDVFVIGGYSLYEEALPYVDTMYITEIDSSYVMSSADMVFFPEYDTSQFNKRVISEHCENWVNYRFVEYTRKN